MLAPLRSIESVKSSLIDTDAVTWEFFPISRKSTKEDVTVASLRISSSSSSSSPLDGYLNLCNGRRGGGDDDDIAAADAFVSCPEVVEALTELQVPFYSGPNLRSAKYNRKDVVALAFYATEEMPGVLLPCHGTVKISKQSFYESEAMTRGLEEKNEIRKNSDNKAEECLSPSSSSSSSSSSSTEKAVMEKIFERSGEMVDKLHFPVVVRPVAYSHRNSDEEEVVCYNFQERVKAQRRFFEYGHSSVFVDEFFDKKSASTSSVSVLCFGCWDSVNKKSQVKVMPSFADLRSVHAKFGGASASLDDIRHRVSILAEKLFRGVYDDATCCAPLRGHCLIRLVASPPNDGDASQSVTWIIRDIIPNCTLLGDSWSSSSSSSASAAAPAPALAILAEPEHNLKPRSPEFSNFFASLVEINQAPPRFVELPYRVEYDPQHRWYGLCASRDITQGEIVFHDEATAFTIVTKPFVEEHWSADLKEVFSRYGWPLDSAGHLYAVWSEDPQKWRPVNHHCDPNTTFAAPHSLNCVATRNIAKGETLTLDYATFCDYTMKPFNCRCGASCCRGLIEPTAEALSKYGNNAWHRIAPKKPQSPPSS